MACSCCIECQAAFPEAPSTHLRVTTLSAASSRDDAYADAQSQKPFAPLSLSSVSEPSPLHRLREEDLHGQQSYGPCMPNAYADAWVNNILSMEPCSDSHELEMASDNPTPHVSDVLQTALQQAAVLRETSDLMLRNGNTSIMESPVQYALVRTEASEESGSQLVETCPDAQDDEDEARTMMICNLPCRIRYNDLVEAIKSVGLDFEFVHLPRRLTSLDSNMGYAFVHFFNPTDAARFALAFEGFRFSQSKSRKVCKVRIAKLQGYNGGHRVARHMMHVWHGESAKEWRTQGY